MVLSIIAEPRSGSMNLHKWLEGALPEFDCQWENAGMDRLTKHKRRQLYYGEKWFKSDINYIISEKYYNANYENLIRLIDHSDKVIALYRENGKEQIESFVSAHLNNKWDDSWVEQPHIFENLDTLYSNRVEYFEELKRNFKSFREEANLKTFSYEDLYERGKINEFLEYFELEINDPWPKGYRYRKAIKERTLI